MHTHQYQIRHRDGLDATTSEDVFNCGVDIPAGSQQSADVLLGVRETHVVELLSHRNFQKS